VDLHFERAGGTEGLKCHGQVGIGQYFQYQMFDGLGEYKINWGPGYRIYLIQEGKRLIILFGGGDKSTQKKDIKQAKALIAEFRIRKKAEQSRR
jgi:putative addiction module killer protein